MLKEEEDEKWGEIDKSSVITKLLELVNCTDRLNMRLIVSSVCVKTPVGSKEAEDSRSEVPVRTELAVNESTVAVKLHDCVNEAD
jgi:hypothetical protein